MKGAIVTGGNGGIGSAIVDVLIEMNYNVSSFDIKDNKDITNKYHIKDYLETHYKSIEVLINCAGVTKGEQLKINLEAPYIMAQQVLPYMKKKGGSIINITSLWSERGFKGNPYYGMSKGGLKMLTKCLAVEWAEYNIRVNNIGLGYFKTDMTKYSWKNRKKEVDQRIPLKRWGKPEDIKPAIKFLIECKYITGADIYIDGGWLAWGGL